MSARLKKMVIDFVSFVDSPAEDGSRVMLAKRDFSTDTRDKLAAEGKAMPHGGFPIPDKGALRRAIQAVGRAKDPEATKRFIMKRARELDATDMLPESWTVSKNDPTAGNVHVDVPMGMAAKKPPKEGAKNRKKLLVDGEYGDETDSAAINASQQTSLNPAEQGQKTEAKKPLFGRKKVKKSDDEDDPFWTDQPKNTTGPDQAVTVSEQNANVEDNPMASEQLEKVLKGDFSALPTELVEYIEKLEDTVIDLETKIEAADAEPDATEGDDTGGGTVYDQDAEEIEDAMAKRDGEPEDILKAAGPAVRELFTKMQGQLAETEAIAKAERDARLDREFTDLAKSYEALPSSTDDIKAILKSAAALDQDALAKLTEVLSASNEMAKQSALLEEVGKRAPASGSVEEKVEQLAKSYQKDHADLTYEQAYDSVLQENRDLYRQIQEG